MPAFSPDAPSDVWDLSSEGHREARALTRSIPSGSLLVASREPKAQQTLEPAGPVHTDKRFNEVVRDEPYHGDFRARRRAYVTGTEHLGWEPREQVVSRFAAGLQFWSDQAEGRPLVVATHGMAMALWLTATIGLTDPGTFWDTLRLPDLLSVDVAGSQVTRLEYGAA